MIYSFEITTPANTLQTLPLITNLHVTKGVIHYWSVYFPPGQQRSSQLQFRKGAISVMPSNPEGHIAGHGTTTEGRDFFYVKNPPYILQAISWNLDTIWDHGCSIMIYMLPLWTFSPYSEQMVELIEQEEIFKVG